MSQKTEYEKLNNTNVKVHSHKHHKKTYNTAEQTIQIVIIPFNNQNEKKMMQCIKMQNCYKLNSLNYNHKPIFSDKVCWT